MDLATQLAFRAIVRGLYDSNAIGSEQVRAVASALKDAAGVAMDQGEPEPAKALVALAKGIKIDVAVT
jgi:hypothetical protein